MADKKECRQAGRPRGRPKGSSKLGEKRKQFAERKHGKTKKAKNGSEHRPSSHRVIQGNIEIDAEDLSDIPWLSADMMPDDEVHDTDKGLFGYDDAKGIFQTVYKGLPKSDEMTVAVSMYSYFVEELRWGIELALKHTSKMVGRSVKTIRSWRDLFYNNEGVFPESTTGKYQRQLIFSDEDLGHKAKDFIRQNTCIKGKPNMRVADFRNWVNQELLSSAHLPSHFPKTISLDTARRWIHKLGFSYTNKKKGTYIDGHEREDVQEARKTFIETVTKLENDHLPPPKCEDEVDSEVDKCDREERKAKGQKQLVMIFHDESAFSANDDERKLWTDGQTGHIRPKGRGSGIMVSDFVDEHNGYLRLTPKEHEKAKEMGMDIKNPEARFKFEYGQNREGFWDKDKFMVQVRNSIKIAKVKYPEEEYDIVWLFDQSSGHTAFADDALNTKKLNMKPGGKQPCMHDTVYKGRAQKMVFESGPKKGQPKGAHQILKERGYREDQIKSWKLEGCVKELQKHDDFKSEVTMLEKVIRDAGHTCLFIPKYHCELNAIERCWCRAKVFTRSHCNYSITGLRQVWREALETVDVEDIRKYCRRVREYMQAYREGYQGVIAVEKAVKIYKSHRRVHHTK